MTLFNEETVLYNIPPKNTDAITIALAFPNTYEIGIASLGYQTAWKLFNQNESIRTVRWFTNIQESNRNFNQSLPYLGFSLSWELDYKNIFLILEKNNVPLHSRNRGEDDPIVFCGGQVVNANPKPFCKNFDFFLTGDLEASVSDLIKKILEIKTLKREEKLKELSAIPSVYVPEIGSVSIKRKSSNNELASSSILTRNSIWPNVFLLEVVRSCPELCRFCLASYGSLPFRTPIVQKSLIPKIEQGLKHTNKIGLLGASVTQHPEFEELVDYLITRENINVQTASVRADSITNKIANGLYKLGSKSITMAIESGSERLKELINKKVSNETIIKSIETIYGAGFNSIKLYGMVGLPREEFNDLEETIKLLKEIKQRNKTKKLIFGCSVFVPKAQTPFQWYGMDKEASKKLKFYSKELHKLGIEFRAESYKWSLIQALISRGDESINDILELAYRYGSTLGAFNKAINENKTKVDTNHFIFNNLDESCNLPWDNIHGHLNKEIIIKHSREVTNV